MIANFENFPDSSVTCNYSIKFFFRFYYFLLKKWDANVIAAYGASLEPKIQRLYQNFSKSIYVIKIINIIKLKNLKDNLQIKMKQSSLKTSYNIYL